MKAVIGFLFFSLAIVVVLAGYQDHSEPEEQLTADDFFEYFELENSGEEILEVQKRKKQKQVGPCISPTGIQCQVCNLKITDENNMSRYLLCKGPNDPSGIPGIGGSKGKGKGKGRGKGRGRKC